MGKRLWLFDVDGTLVDTTKLHVVAYRKAYQEVTGKVIPDVLIEQRFGMPATKGHDLVLSSAGIAYNEKMIGKVVTKHQIFFAEETKKVKIVPLNGVAALLVKLKKEGDVLGVVTGNFEAPAQNILSNAGLLSFFSFLSCDTGNDDRAAIVRRGVDLGRKKCPLGKVIVVGDTPSDVRAGQAVGAFTVAVATGVFSAEALKKEKPSVVVNSLQDVDAIMASIERTSVE